ncbi:LysR family transcriptional regulator [Paraburkholderia sp. GAS334]|jgi:LysR family transcriptional regulator for bpeEF and oprC|uniref:LysR family transcriptional regulator n=1 Tax=Paraburkholderia sp. GAS334 TaxID=3035131 RepID=UPI003D1F850D
MDRFQSMQVFTRIVELSSFTRAADALGLPRATVTHTIKQLEARLGVRLLQRTTRSVSATLDGDAYYRRCVRLLADLEETESVFTEASVKPKGKLRVDMQATLAHEIVLPELAAFCELYPELDLDIGFGDRTVDMVREGFDCVLRAGTPKDSTMVARRLAAMEQVTCASSAYLDRHGEPKTLDDLANHWAVNYTLASTGRAWPLEFIVDGTRREVEMKGRISVSNADAYFSCCVVGMGLVQVPRYHAMRAIANGTVREVLRNYVLPTMPVSAMYPHHRQLSPRVRVFVDWLAGLFGQWDAGAAGGARGG